MKQVSDSQLCDPSDSAAFVLFHIMPERPLVTTASYSTVQLMTSHQFDLRVGETIRLGDYRVTLLEADETEGDVGLEIEGPDGDVFAQPICGTDSEVEELACV